MAEEKTKILVIQTAYLGDVILVLPMIQTLKNLLPNSEIDLLCIPVTANAAQNHPDINRVIKYDKKGKDKLGKLLEVISEVKRNNYDIIISPHRSTRSALIMYSSHVPVKIGFDKNSMSFQLTTKVPYVKESHEIQRNLDLLTAVPGVELDDEKISGTPKLYPSEHDKKLVAKLLEGAGDKLISFAPFSKWFTKQMPKALAISVINEIFTRGYGVVLVGGGEDFEYAKSIEHEVNDSRLINLCGRLSPLESYEAINHTKALIAVDSAAQHLGAASDVPVALVYGSTDRSFGFFPLKEDSVIIENTLLDCRPCTDHGKKACPLGHFKCMNDLSAENIVNETIKLITKG